MRIVTKKGVDLIVFFELLGHIAMSFLPMAVPLSLLFSLIYCLNKLSEDSEIVALRAMGIPKIKIFMPFLLIGILCSVTIFSLNRSLIPYSKRLFKNTLITLTSKGFLADIKKEQFYTDIPKVILFAEEVEEGGKYMENVFIKLKNNNDKDKVIMAKKGVLVKSSEQDGPSLSLKMDLYEGNIISLNKGGEEVEKILFEKYEFPIVSSSSGRFVNKDSMKPNEVLVRDLKIERGRIVRESGKKKQNKKLIKNLENRVRKIELEYWTRFNVPLQCIAFVLMGFVFGIKKGRGKSKNTSAIALILTIFYYVLFFSGVSMVKKGTIDPAIAVFLPTIIIFIISSYYYKKLDWAS